MYVYLCALMSTKYKFVDNIASNASEVKYILALNDKINFRAVPYDRGVSNNVTVYLCIYEDIFVHEDVIKIQGIFVRTYLIYRINLHAREQTLFCQRSN